MGQYFTHLFEIRYIGAIAATAIFFIEKVKRRLKERKELEKYLVDGFEEGTIGPDGQLVSSWGQWVSLDD